MLSSRVDLVLVIVNEEGEADAGDAFHAKGRSMTTTPDDQERALRLIFRSVSPAAGDPGEDLVLRLREVREARGDVLTDDEYQAFRADIIEQIIGRVGMPWILSVVFALGCVMGAGFLGWGIWTGDGGAGVGGRRVRCSLCSVVAESAS